MVTLQTWENHFAVVEVASRLSDRKSAVGDVHGLSTPVRETVRGNQHGRGGVNEP